MGGFAPDDRLVGLFALNEIVRGVAQSAHAAWQVSAGFAGRGFGTEGVRAILDLAFTPTPDGLGLHRVQAYIMPANAASLRIAEKVGFRQEGLARSCLRIAGRWEDHVMHALLAEEWPTGI
jgi:ribosomal-protein-alanine N-acetyltransferase